jgi:hypothetical protein
MLTQFSVADIIGRFLATYLIPEKDLPKYSYLIVGWSIIRMLLIYTSV